MTARVSSIWTCWPAFTFTALTTPLTGEETACSIFIASTTSSGCPLVTWSPAFTRTARTVPGMGERTVPSALAAPPPRTGAARSSVSAQDCPSRPSQIVVPSVAPVLSVTHENRKVRPPYLSSRLAPAPSGPGPPLP